MIERKKVDEKDRCFFMSGEVKTFISGQAFETCHAQLFVYLDGELIEIDEKVFRHNFEINKKLTEERDNAVRKLDAIKRVLGITEDDDDR